MGFFKNIFRKITGRGRESVAEQRLGKYTGRGSASEQTIKPTTGNVERQRGLAEQLGRPDLGIPRQRDIGTALDIGRDTVVDAGYELTDLDTFLYFAEWLMTPASSNVRGMQYHYDDKKLIVAFHGGRATDAYYEYYDVNEEDAREMYQRAQSSAGGAVWDLLRVRGSRCLHAHDYSFLPGPSSYHPKWHCSDAASGTFPGDKAQRGRRRPRDRR